MVKDSTLRQMSHSHKNSFSIKSAFQNARHYLRENKIQSSALFTSLLLGTTALVNPALLAPLISTPSIAAATLFGSIALLVQNGKTTVQNTLGLGNKWGLSAMSLGVIIGSLNTIPETAVSVNSVLQGALELGTGNVVGSNIAHMLLILGLPALVMGIDKAKDLSWKFNTYVMAGTAALFGSQLVMGTFSPLIGAAMLGMGGYYIYKRFCNTGNEHKHEHHHNHEHEHHHDHNHDHEEEIGSCAFHDHNDDKEIEQAKKRPAWLNATLAGGGMLGLIAASNLIVSSGINIADQFNWSSLGLNWSLGQATIGTLVVAIGTAIPEIAISIEAIRKKSSDLAIGNVLGCSIINTLVAGGILSMSGLINDFSLLSAMDFTYESLANNFNLQAVKDFVMDDLIKGIPVPEAFTLNSNIGLLNTGVFLGTAGILTTTLLATKGAFNRWMGGAALLAYAGYIVGALTLNDGKMPELHQHEHTDTPTTEVIKTRDLPRLPLPLPSPHH